MMVMFQYVAKEENFDGDGLVDLLGGLFKLIEEDYYGKIMRVIWT